MAKVVPFVAKGGPVLMAKGGILLVAEIGILYLTIYNNKQTHQLEFFQLVSFVHKGIILWNNTSLEKGQGHYNTPIAQSSSILGWSSVQKGNEITAIF